MPFFPASLFVVCIDLPGHGYSSHFSPGVLLNFMDYVLTIKRVADYFCWSTFYYLGHSFGAQIGAYFSAFYPQYVAKLIMLDAIASYYPLDNIKRHAQVTRKLLDNEVKMAGRKRPSYSYEEALERIKINRISKLDNEAAIALLKRSVVPYENGYSFSTDQRLKIAVWSSWNAQQNLQILKNIKCPQLIIFARESLPVMSLNIFRPVMQIYKSRKNFHYKVVEGNHDVHNNNPERVAPLVEKFLIEFNSKL